MTQAVVVLPWRSAPSRIPAFEQVVAWYARHLPELSITTVDTDDDPFVLAACRNRAIREAPDGAVVVINDADTLPEVAPLRAAIAAAASSPLVHLPYTEYRWLGAHGSAQVAAGVPLADCDHTVIDGACSGVYVATASTWASHGGQDEGFRGWGFEDAAWRLAHITLLGAPPARHPGRVFALHHRAEVREGAGYEANAARMQRYRDADGDRDAMAELVGLDRTAAPAPAGSGDLDAA